MRRAALLAFAIGLVVAFVVLLRPGNDRGPPTTGRARSADRPTVRTSTAASGPGVFSDLGLPGGESVRVLDADERDLLFLYPVGADALDVASTWSLALTSAGFQRMADRSRPGRTVLQFADAGEAVLLAVGSTREGPFVSLSRPSKVEDHWATRPDADAPLALRPLLPPPSAPLAVQ